MSQPTSTRSTTPPLTDRDHRDAWAASGWRVLFLLAAWAVTYQLRADLSLGLSLGINAAFAVSGWWALWPGYKRGGDEFGEKGHWTGFLFIPVTLFMLPFLADLVELAGSIKR